MTCLLGHKHLHLKHFFNFFVFFGPCIFNNEDKKINQQNAQITPELICAFCRFIFLSSFFFKFS